MEAWCYVGRWNAHDNLHYAGNEYEFVKTGEIKVKRLSSVDNAGCCRVSAGKESIKWQQIAGEMPLQRHCDMLLASHGDFSQLMLNELLSF
jgi:hypothetical protein